MDFGQLVELCVPPYGWMVELRRHRFEGGIGVDREFETGN
jgi:hypothetical protein